MRPQFATRLSAFTRAGFIDAVGDDNVCPDLPHAIARAHHLLPNLMGGHQEDY